MSGPIPDHKRKWHKAEDGLFHCPHCSFTHKRAASLGRHAAIHSGKPYARNTQADLQKRYPASASRKERDRIRKQKERDYAKEYYLRTKATKKLNPEETSHVNGTGAHQPEIDQTIYFLAGGWAKELQSAARALERPVGELADRIIKVLRSTTLR